MVRSNWFQRNLPARSSGPRLGLRFIGAAAAFALSTSANAQEPKRGADSEAALQNKSVPLRADLLGIRLGQSFDEAWAKLSALGERDGRETRDGGKRYAWRLADEHSVFEWIVVRSNREGRITALTGMLRAGKEIPLTELGDLDKAIRHNDAGAVWDGRDATGKVTYRLVAKGPAGKTKVMYFMAAPRRDRNEVNVVLPPDQRPPPGMAVDDEPETP